MLFAVVYYLKKWMADWKIWTLMRIFLTNTVLPQFIIQPVSLASTSNICKKDIIFCLTKIFQALKQMENTSKFSGFHLKFYPALWYHPRHGMPNITSTLLAWKHIRVPIPIEALVARLNMKKLLKNRIYEHIHWIDRNMHSASRSG